MWKVSPIRYYFEPSGLRQIFPPLQFFLRGNGKLIPRRGQTQLPVLFLPKPKDTVKKTWYVKFRYKDWMGNAKWVTRRGFRTKAEALRFEEDFKLKMSGNLEMSFADFVEVYIDKGKETGWLFRDR